MAGAILGGGGRNDAIFGEVEGEEEREGEGGEGEGEREEERRGGDGGREGVNEDSLDAAKEKEEEREE